jgi:hypothetical protein
MFKMEFTYMLSCVEPKVLVGEPSVPDTIQILRGLKDKYESHHGVRIHDRALVVAAELSDRYIQGRFLPDKVMVAPSALYLTAFWFHAKFQNDTIIQL